MRREGKGKGKRRNNKKNLLVHLGASLAHNNVLRNVLVGSQLERADVHLDGVNQVITRQTLERKERNEEWKKEMNKE